MSRRRRRHQPVLAIVDIGVRPVAGQVAAGVVGVSGPGNCAVLVKAVDRIGLAGRRDRCEGVAVV